MSAKRRGTAVVIFTFVLLLAGCGGDSGDSTSTDRSTTDPLTPTSSATPGVLPKGAEITDWAETAMPENSLGGATYAERSSGTLTPDMDAVISLAQPVGEWELTIACQSENGSSLTVTADPVEVNALDPLRCGQPGVDVVGATMSIAFDIVDQGERSVTLSASADAVYVYEVSPRAGGLD
ncbi:hypothetical protein ACWPKO_29075 (plasmid) [Coraliomargarita sp. W4R53]